MTLIEFLAPLKTSSARDKCLAVLYHRKHREGAPGMQVNAIRADLLQARVPRAAKINVSNVMARAGALVDSSPGDKGRRLWHLTNTGDRYIREKFTLPEDKPTTQHDVATLTNLSATISDETVRGYVDEAIKCLRVEGLRAVVVFVWSGAIWTLQDRALAKGGPAVTAALWKHQPKAREIKAIEDLGWINDATFLLAATDLHLIDKSQAKILGQALDLRNACGHPTKYNPGEKKVSSFIEDVVGIVFK